MNFDGPVNEWDQLKPTGDVLRCDGRMNDHDEMGRAYGGISSGKTNKAATRKRGNSE